MQQKAENLWEIRQNLGRFKLSGLAALVATAVIWLYAAIDMPFAAAAYFAFLIVVSVLYPLIGSRGDSTAGSDKAGK